MSRKKNEFVFAACNHLTKYPWKYRQSITGDAYNSFEQLITYCVTNKLPLILGGDLFDSVEPSPQDIRVFRRGVERMESNNLEVFYIQGQHERRDPPWVLAVCDTVVYVNETTFEPVPGLVCYGLDNRKKDDVEEACAHIPPEATVLVMHQLERSLFNMEDVWDFDPEWLPSNIDTVIAGDDHRDVAFRYKREDGSEVNGIYSGSQHPLSTDDTRNKSFLHFTFDGKDLSYKRVPLHTRKITKETVNTEEEFDKLIQTLQSMPVVDADTRPIMAVKCNAGIPSALSRMKFAASDKCHLFFYPFMVSDTGDEIQVEDRPGGSKMIDYLTEFCEDGKELYSFMSDFLGTGDPREAIKALTAPLAANKEQETGE